MKALVLALVLGILCGCGGSQSGRVTLRNFKKIVSGMSAEQTKKLMGSPARIERRAPAADGKEAYVYHWVGDDGFEYSAWFKGGIVGPTQWKEPMNRE